MSRNHAKTAARKTVRASIDLDHHIVEGQDLFALPKQSGFAGPCDGKADGTSCGEGCTCLAGQPLYSRDAVARLGFQLPPRPDE